MVKLKDLKTLEDLKSFAGMLITLAGINSINIIHQLLSSNYRNIILYLDFKDTFDPFRIAQNAKRRHIPPKSVLSKIMISRSYSIHQAFTLIMEYLGEAIVKFNPLAVIVAELLHPFYTAEAEPLLNQICLKLRKLAYAHKIPIIVTLSQVGRNKRLENLLLKRSQIKIEV